MNRIEEKCEIESVMQISVLLFCKLAEPDPEKSGLLTSPLIKIE